MHGLWRVSRTVARPSPPHALGGRAQHPTSAGLGTTRVTSRPRNKLLQGDRVLAAGLRLRVRSPRTLALKTESTQEQALDGVAAPRWK